LEKLHSKCNRLYCGGWRVSPLERALRGELAVDLAEETDIELILKTAIKLNFPSAFHGELDADLTLQTAIQGGEDP